MNKKHKFEIVGSLLAEYHWVNEFGALELDKVYWIGTSGQYFVVTRYHRVIDDLSYESIKYHIYDTIRDIEKSKLYPVEMVNRILYK